MTISFLSQFNKKHKKKGGRVNPHLFWNIFVISFLVSVTIFIVLTTFFFIQATRNIDALVLPRIDTGIRPTEKIRQQIEKTEKAVEERTGVPFTDIAQ